MKRRDLWFIPIKKNTWMLCFLMLSACGPSEKQKAESAERKRVECLEKFCEGDVIPKRNVATEVALKLNGQSFIGPKEYFSGGNGAVFYWPSKTPQTGQMDGYDYPEKGKPFYDVAIEIFLRTPRQLRVGMTMYRALLDLENKGMVIEKRQVRPGLEVWHVQEGKRLPRAWYVATGLKEPQGDPPTLSCDDFDPKNDRCTTGFMWKYGIAASMRFHGMHSLDWPEIYLETSRVLNLLKKG